MVFDLTDNTGKKQHNAVDLKAMMQLALSFNNVSLLNKLNCNKCRDKTNWPTRNAHHVMLVIVKEYELEDTMAKVEMEHALAKLEPKKIPNELLNKFASIKCQYLLELSESKKEAQTLQLGGTQYSSIIATT
jgi:hypothetical protein